MPWIPALDEIKWKAAIQEIETNSGKTEDQFTEGDWSEVAKKYVDEGGRFKDDLAAPPPVSQRLNKSSIKRVSGLMTSDVDDEVGKVVERLEKSKGKVAADMARALHRPVPSALSGVSPSSGSSKVKGVATETGLPVIEGKAHALFKARLHEKLKELAGQPDSPKRISNATARNNEEVDDLASDLARAGVEEVLEATEEIDFEDVARRLIDKLVGVSR
jgi:hypothetical protein